MPCFAAKPDVTLTITDSDLVDMMSGRLNSQKAFFQGKLKVSRYIIVVGTPPLCKKPLSHFVFLSLEAKKKT